MERMKRFWLFAGSTYYPSGGMKDFRGSFDTVDEAHAWLARRDYEDWAHIFDSRDGYVILHRSDGGPWVNKTIGPTIFVYED